jgi:quercetin dioxygenase-like cupin family protein
MSSALEHNLGSVPAPGSRSARSLQRARVLNRTDLPHGALSYEFEGRVLGDVGASVIVVDAPPGGGPRLHKHPYPEIFVMLEGQAMFTAGEDVIAASGGQIVVVPAGMPHKFVNSGTGPLRQVDIHPSDTFITEWLEE